MCCFAAFWKLGKIWKSNQIPIQLKRNIFRTSYLSMLLSGCKSWVFTQELEDCINSYGTKCYSIILGIRYQGRVANATIYIILTTNQQPLSHLIRKRQLKWLGHITRKPNDELINMDAFYDHLCTWHKKKRTNERESYTTRTLPTARQSPFHQRSPAEIRNTALDRSHWRKLVTDHDDHAQHIF